MKMLTKEILEEFKKQGSTDGKKPEEVKIICKFFNPTGRGTWYATEFNEQERLFFGFVSLFGDSCDELGYFSLDELQALRLPLGLSIERDLNFGVHYLKEVLEGARP